MKLYGLYYVVGTLSVWVQSCPVLKGVVDVSILLDTKLMLFGDAYVVYIGSFSYPEQLSKYEQYVFFDWRAQRLVIIDGKYKHSFVGLNV